MELTIQKKDFLKAIKKTYNVSGKNSTMPILSTILITTEGKDKIKLEATDLYIGVSSHANAQIKEEGSVAVSAKTLYDIINSLPEGEISWKKEGKQIHLQRAKVNFKLPTMNIIDFPPLPNPGNVEFRKTSAKDLIKLISMTQYAMSTDDTRPHLAATLFETEKDILRMVSTDTHRLSKSEIKASIKVDNDSDGFSLLIPHKGIIELKKILESFQSDSKDKIIDVAKVGGNIFFKSDDFSLNIRLVDEQFPPYQKVIPKSFTRHVVLSKKDLIDSLKRIQLVAVGGIQFHLSDGLIKIQSQNPEIGEGFEEVSVDFAGEPLSIGFNARYLLDVLNSIEDEEIIFDLSGELDPCIIRIPNKEDAFTGVIMPMRI